MVGCEAIGAGLAKGAKEFNYRSIGGLPVDGDNLRGIAAK
jgi:hypothetical protein